MHFKTHTAFLFEENYKNLSKVTGRKLKRNCEGIDWMSFLRKWLPKLSINNFSREWEIIEQINSNYSGLFR